MLSKGGGAIKMDYKQKIMKFLVEIAERDASK